MVGRVVNKHQTRPWKRGVTRVALLVFCLNLAACALAPSSTPVPVEDRNKRPAPSTADPGVGKPVPQPEQTPMPVPEPLPPPVDVDRPAGITAPKPPAVVALLERVTAASAKGNHAQAAAELERALRISPRDGDLWLRLARVRLQQSQWQQAETLAQKCVSLPESDGQTRKGAWGVIGSAREAQGDGPGAAAARQRAAVIKIP